MLPHPVRGVSRGIWVGRCVRPRPVYPSHDLMTSHSVLVCWVRAFWITHFCPFTSFCLFYFLPRGASFACGVSHKVITWGKALGESSGAILHSWNSRHLWFSTPLDFWCVFTLCLLGFSLIYPSIEECLNFGGGLALLWVEILCFTVGPLGSGPLVLCWPQ